MKIEVIVRNKQGKTTKSMIYKMACIEYDHDERILTINNDVGIEDSPEILWDLIAAKIMQEKKAKEEIVIIYCHGKFNTFEGREQICYFDIE